MGKRALILTLSTSVFTGSTLAEGKMTMKKLWLFHLRGPLKIPSPDLI
ncbi:hypothetical protein EDF75_2049 [Raoultella sp. BIGb0149]|nr:hypothetical protein EDF75_2049 [Raoultella sp. BIGb0149]